MQPYALKVIFLLALLVLIPGVRPIGIVVGSDILDVVGAYQLCVDQEGGCEAAVHAPRQLFESADCEAVLFVMLVIHSICLIVKQL